MRKIVHVKSSADEAMLGGCNSSNNPLVNVFFKKQPGGFECSGDLFKPGEGSSIFGNAGSSSLFGSSSANA